VAVTSSISISSSQLHLQAAGVLASSMSHPSQPAAELIANALAKIKKLAGNKKHADLAQECQQLIDSIQEVRLVTADCPWRMRHTQTDAHPGRAC
jgi:hypothetical protein